MNLTHGCSSAGKGIIDEGKPFQACKHLANIFDVYACTKPTATKFDAVRGSNKHEAVSYGGLSPPAMWMTLVWPPHGCSGHLRVETGLPRTPLELHRLASENRMPCASVAATGCQHMPTELDMLTNTCGQLLNTSE